MYSNVLRSGFSQRRQVIVFQQKIEKNCSLCKLKYFFKYFQVPMFWKAGSVLGRGHETDSDVGSQEKKGFEEKEKNCSSSYFVFPAYIKCDGFLQKSTVCLSSLTQFIQLLYSNYEK
jgi:hypothetical protein